MKKLLFVLLTFCMLLQLCACGEDTGSAPSATDDPGILDPAVAELICRTWYPDFDMAEGCVTFFDNMTCDFFGELLPYQIVNQNEEEITLDVGGNSVIFLVRNPEFVVMFEGRSGLCVPYQGLWEFDGAWHDEQGNVAFQLDLGEIPYLDFQLDAGENFLNILVTDGDQPVYHVLLSLQDRPTAEVVEEQSGSSRYFFLGSSGGNGGSCDHSYILLDTQAATCTETGSKFYQCQWCNHNYTETLPKADHNYVNRICQVCGTEKTQGSLLFELTGEGTAYTVAGIGTWDEPEVVIPATYNGLPVQSIKENAFRDCTFIQRVVVPESVIVIHSFAFRGCTGLTSVELSEGLVTLGDGIFVQCTSLRSIRIPNSVTNMGHSAFVSCEALEECILPNGLTELGGSTFYDCHSLAKIDLPDTLFRIDDRAFLACYSLKSVTLPENLCELGAFAFEACSNLETINIPKGVKELPKWCFGGCYNLSITIPKQVNSVVDGAVSSCKTIRVEPGNTHYQVKGNCLIEVASKKLVSAGLSFTIPTDGSVTAYGSFSFFANTMTSIVLPDCIKDLGEGMFSGCDSLVNITLPKGVTKLPNHMFVGIPIAHMEIPNTVTHIGANTFLLCEKLETVVIPNSVVSIGDYAFAECTALRSIVIPNSITRLGVQVFQGCTALSQVTLPESLVAMDSAFLGCSALESITLPSRLTELNGTFYDCTGLKSITIPASVTTIGNNTFRGCKSLETVTVPNTVKTMGDAVFMDCTNLKSAVLPEGLTAIPQLTFSWCENLETVTIPATVTTIYTHAFCLCNKLQSICFGGTQDQWNKISVEGTFNDALAKAQIICR